MPSNLSMKRIYRELLEVNFALACLPNTIEELVEGESPETADFLLSQMEHLDTSLGSLKESLIELMEEMVGEGKQRGEQTDNGIKL